MLTPEHLEAFEKLRRQAIPGDEETEVLVQKAVDVNYWRSLNVELEVMSDHSEKMADAVRVSEEEQLQAAHHLVEHGYFRLPPSCDSQLIARMRTGVEAVRKAGWPAVFSYVYDEFWAIFRQPPVVRLLKSYLGEKYQQSADFWTYYVDPKAHGSGWSPHVDSPQTDRRMAIWLPLSDATVDNGCIYVVPQDRVPPSLPVKFGKWDFISRKDLETLFHGVTPLPAKADRSWGGTTA